MKQSSSTSPMLGLALGLALIAGTASAQNQTQSAEQPTTSDKIDYYRQQIAEHPKHYPAYARLGRAWLDRARQTYDPADLAEARTALRRSLAIQPNYEALHDLAAAANYAHRFDEALDWCQQAAEALPEDRGVIAMQVEALLALGRGDDARAAIGGKVEPALDFYTAAALGHWHLAQGQREAAVARFLEAARLAKQRHATSHAAWATVTAAGVWLDSGDLVLAKPLLDAATMLDPTDRFLKIHLAELAEAEARPPEALRIYEELLMDQADPELHRRAFVLAKQLGRNLAADEHLAAAEKLCRRAIEAGEAFGLETLANLYCDAGRHAQAVRLAEQNLQHKRDAAAHATLARARQPNAHGTSGSPLSP
jgi:tetratricopeptide (TPR) repeat protein